MKYFDAHCHNYIPNHDLIGAIVNATSGDDWQNVIQSQSASVFGAIGIHPWVIASAPSDWESRMESELLKHHRLMVGEIGLDNTCDDIDIQESVFIKQMQIAHRLSRVVNIHCVHAWDKILHILKNHPLPPRMVFHSFSGNTDIIKNLPKNSYFSYGMEIISKDSGKSRERIIATPNDRILVESDNAGAESLPLIVDKIAEIKKLTNSKMADIILNNSHRVISHDI